MFNNKSPADERMMHRRDAMVRSASALADWLATPPFAIAHLPFGGSGTAAGERHGDDQTDPAPDGGTDGFGLFSLDPANVHLTACRRSWDRKALVLRLHETAGQPTQARLSLSQPLRVISL